MAINIEELKKKLSEERSLVEQELRTVGRINPDNPNDWEATAEANSNLDLSEQEERATGISDFADRNAVEFELEERFNEIRGALANIENGTYGHCIVCKKDVEEDRLNANPAAQTCKQHME